MSFQSVSEQLVILQEANAQLKVLIDRLANLKFQPGSVPLSDDDDEEEGNIITELTTEIQQTLREQEEDFENLLEDVYDLPDEGPGTETEGQKLDIDATVKRAVKELKIYEKDYRRAYLSAKKNLEVARRQERALLLQSYLEPESNTPAPAPKQYRRKQQAELSKEEKEINASSDVTAALRRTHDMMTAELSRSQFARETLNESSAALAQLSESYSTLDSLLSSSRNLLGTLLRSQKSDTWYLETAFYVLSVTIAWLIFRRLLYGPLWWLLWFPLRIFFRSWMGVLTALGLVGGSDIAVSSMSMVAARETVVHNSATRDSMPTISGANAPSINVGGGGRGAPMKPTYQPRRSVPEGSGGVLSEQVAKIIEESENTADSDPGVGEGSGQSEAEPEQQPNPKKRMWEEEKEAGKEEQKNKDEL